MSVDKTSVNSATFTFAAKPELLVGGKKQPFTDMEVDGKKIKGVVLKDGSIARLDKGKGGKWDVTLTASDGRDLSKRSIHIGEGGSISRLGTVKGDEYNNLKDNREMLSGRTLKLNDEWFKKLTKGAQPTLPEIELRDPKKKKKTEKTDDEAIELVSLKPRPRSTSVHGTDDQPKKTTKN